MGVNVHVVVSLLCACWLLVDRIQLARHSFDGGAGARMRIFPIVHVALNLSAIQVAVCVVVVVP